MSAPTTPSAPPASDLATTALDHAKNMENTPPKRKPLPPTANEELLGKTESHRLSQEAQDGLVSAERPDDPAEVVDLGWHRPSIEFEDTLVAGLSNEDLWMLVRRFDKVSLDSSVSRHH